MTNFNRHIIVGGPPRSGSTLLRFILDRSAKIVSGPETNFFLFTLEQHQTARLDRTTARLSDKLELESSAVRDAIVRAETLCDAFDRIMRLYLAGIGGTANAWAEKTPRNCLHYRRLAAEAPHVQFVSTIRNGLDIVTSKITENSRRGDEYWCSIDRYIESMEHVYSFEHPNHRILKYEDLVRSPEDTVKELFLSLGEPYSPEVIENFNRPSKSRDLKKVQQPKLKMGMTDQWVDRWQRPEHAEQVAAFQRNDRAMHWLEVSGYAGDSAGRRRAI